MGQHASVYVLQPQPTIKWPWNINLIIYICLDSNIRLYRDELNENFRDIPTLAELSDGSGIYGSVSVFHSIHCLKRLRFLLYPENYYPDATEEKMFELQAHAGMFHVFESGWGELICLILEHCLSYLLHSTKCNADLTVFPMQWGKKYGFCITLPVLELTIMQSTNSLWNWSRSPPVQRLGPDTGLGSRAEHWHLQTWTLDAPNIW